LASAKCGGFCGGCGPDTHNSNIPVVKYTPGVGRRAVNTDSMTTVEIDYELGEIKPTKITRYGGIVVSKVRGSINSQSIRAFICIFVLLLTLL